MTTHLMREALCPLYRNAQEAHPGLLLQRGLTEHRGGDNQTKSKHIERICRHAAGDFYRRAYGRWRRATGDPAHFRSVILALETRLFIGLTGGGMLETGCVIGHSHGIPCIPGSTVKGVVNAYARERLRDADGRALCNELFGAPPAAEHVVAVSGLIAFHDAWWVPGSADSPLVLEVVTTHHQDYYGQDGKTPATDFDSPVPNAQIAVRGRFRFVVGGPAGWLELAERMLIDALSTRGAGAKTNAGYGLFSKDVEKDAEARCQWVDTTLADLMAKHRASEDDTLRGQPLAQAWSRIGDTDLKAAALADIRGRWEKHGWWDRPPGRASSRAKKIYDSGEGSGA